MVSASLSAFCCGAMVLITTSQLASILFLFRFFHLPLVLLMFTFSCFGL